MKWRVKQIFITASPMSQASFVSLKIPEFCNYLSYSIAFNKSLLHEEFIDEWPRDGLASKPGLSRHMRASTVGRFQWGSSITNSGLTI
jgi:hypothetical protein